ncbi:Uncharacterised protein [Serratia proteamaculans]|jgi:hypothetical protein|nr:Uncharacterised protein [Serratia proteamaculans]CAI1631970.1 Uncharacterised protein [Serratia proteamaculans]CAI2428617.1 Uncharacterised protein [Serratia proteamaculans]
MKKLFIPLLIASSMLASYSVLVVENGTPQ